MQTKSALGKTNKYSGVVKSVKSAQAPEEPRITPEQVIAAFKSFGFVPNERNHNDIAYWTMKGQSEGQQLIEELHKRRMEINRQEDEEKKSQQERQKASQKAEDDKKRAEEDLLHQQHLGKKAMPRLSDEDLNALFDEYGLPAPDHEWARNHLPNDPKKIRSILEMQRKTADDMMKKHSKNTVNAIPGTPKMGAAAAPMPAGGGMGGPTPMGMQGGMADGSTAVTPFFVGESAVVKITNPNNPQSSTLWLVNPKRKILQPFISEEAFKNAFEDPAEAEKSIITLSSQALGPGGALEGFSPLQGEKGVNNDGSLGEVEFTPNELRNKYGKQDDPAGENKSLSMLDGIFGQIGNQSPQ